MDEYVDILNDAGNATGRTVLKSHAHKNGLLHGTVHVWLYTEDKKLLFQKRSPSKSTFPGLWDISVAGHIVSGETPEVAALRETKEEMGLSISPSDLRPMGTSKSIHAHPNGIIDAEIHHCFLVALKQPIDSLHLQKEEVDDVRLIQADYFMEKILAHELSGFMPISPEYWENMLTHLEKLL